MVVRRRTPGCRHTTRSGARGLAWIMNRSTRTVRNDGTFVKPSAARDRAEALRYYSPTKRTGIHVIGPG
jgi:hypothetical protein